MKVFSVLRNGFHRFQTEQSDRARAARTASGSSGE